jgi:hypothetical protein
MKIESRKTLISRLSGGLGNQLFQYAAARAVALKLDGQVVLDISGLRQNNSRATNRVYELDAFNINANITSCNYRQYFFAKYLPKLYKLLWLSKPCVEHSFAYDPSVSMLQTSAYFLGFWQSYKYFSEFSEILRREISPKKKLSHLGQKYEHLIRSDKNSVAVHVRRGDYVSLLSAANFHGVLPKEYYLNGMRAVLEKIVGANFYFFSDDVDWCVKNFSTLNKVTFIEYSKDRESWEDLILISLCRHHIIANSSFSWWGAWLSDGSISNKNIVIAPKRWFLKFDSNCEDRFPPHWQLI